MKVKAPSLNMRGEFLLPRYALTSAVMTTLATFIGRPLIPSSGGVREVSPEEGGVVVEHFQAVVKCIEEAASTERIVHFVQLWMVLYILSMSVKGASYNPACAAWLTQYVKKHNFLGRYPAASLRLTAALLHHPVIVNKYLRSGGEPHFNAFTHSKCLNWLMGGKTAGANLAATLRYAMWLTSEGHAVTMAVVERDIVPFLQGRRSGSEIAADEAAERQERISRASDRAAQDPNEAHSAFIERLRGCHQLLEEDLAFRAERREEQREKDKEVDAREVAVRRGRPRIEVVDAAEEKAAVVSPEEATGGPSFFPAVVEASLEPVGQPPTSLTIPSPSPPPPSQPPIASPAPAQSLSILQLSPPLPPSSPPAPQSQPMDVSAVPQPVTVQLSAAEGGGGEDSVPQPDVAVQSPAAQPQAAAAAAAGDPDWRPSEAEVQREAEVEAQGVRTLRRTQRVGRPVTRSDGAPEAELEELDEKDWDMSAYELPLPRSPRFVPEKIVGVDTGENGELQFIVKWEGFADLTLEPAEELRKFDLDVVQEFWLGNLLKQEDEKRDWTAQNKKLQEENRKLQEKVEALQKQLQG
jgi:hypothetical protein